MLPRARPRRTSFSPASEPRVLGPSIVSLRWECVPVVFDQCPHISLFLRVTEDSFLFVCISEVNSSVLKTILSFSHKWKESV